MSLCMRVRALDNFMRCSLPHCPPSLPPRPLPVILQVRVQRQRKVLYDRLKVPPAINVVRGWASAHSRLPRVSNMQLLTTFRIPPARSSLAQFRSPLDKAESFPLFSLLAKYTPEAKADKKKRLEAQAADKAAGGAGTAAAPPAVLKFGLNHITTLVEQKKAKLVVIAADVNPIELVVWLPALCKRFGVPYAIVNNKGRLGALVHLKSAAAVALTSFKKEDEAAFEKLVDLSNAKFKDNADARKKWGGGVMGLKTQKRLEIRERLLQAELQKKLLL